MANVMVEVPGGRYCKNKERKCPYETYIGKQSYCALFFVKLNEQLVQGEAVCRRCNPCMASEVDYI